MIKICLSTVLEQEAKACEESATLNPSPISDAFFVLAISYRSLAHRLRDEATPYKKTDANQNT